MQVYSLFKALHFKGILWFSLKCFPLTNFPQEFNLLQFQDLLYAKIPVSFTHCWGTKRVSFVLCLHGCLHASVNSVSPALQDLIQYLVARHVTVVAMNSLLLPSKYYYRSAGIWWFLAYEYVTLVASNLKINGLSLGLGLRTCYIFFFFLVLVRGLFRQHTEVVVISAVS